MTVLPCSRQPARSHVAGEAVDWSGLLAGRAVDGPTTPSSRTAYWRSPNGAGRSEGTDWATGHPWLGCAAPLAGSRRAPS